jgi:gluconolactonase
MKCGVSAGADANSRLFYSVSPDRADGFRCDEDSLWTGAGDGVHCIDPGSSLLDKIFVPAAVANLTLGGLRTLLFLCAAPTPDAVAANRRGCAMP